MERVLPLQYGGLDTNNEYHQTGLPGSELVDHQWEMKVPVNASRWDIVHFEQLMWYWNSSKELETYCGATVPGILFQHIAPWEFQIVVDNMEATGGEGSTVERMGLGAFNSGLFATILQRGDIQCIACGHSHMDDFAGKFCGVTLCLDGSAGYSPYGIDELRGGRVFEIRESDPGDIVTYMVRYDSLN